jgi:outer membrane immunogenic protein
MRYMKILTAFTLVCAFQAGSAVAADWDGFYIGVNQASRTVTGDWTTTETREPDGTVIEDPTSDTEASLKDEESDRGWRVGYNLNLGNFVLSLEAVQEASELNNSIDDRIPGLGYSDSDPTSFVEVHAENDDTNLRLRAGYLVMQQLLFYVAAGKADLDVEVTSTCPADTNVCNPFLGTQSSSNETSLSGDVTGFGLEYQLFDFLLLRVERLEVDYGDVSFTALPEQAVTSFGADATVAVEADVTQFGVSYQF